MRIGELAELTGVPAKTIRYYETIDVLPRPERLANGYRDYGRAAEVRLGFIRDAQAAGLSLREIASILSLRDEGKATCGHVLALLEGHLADLDRRITALRQTRDQLETLVNRARTLDPADCIDPIRCQVIGDEAGGSGSRRPSVR